MWPLWALKSPRRFRPTLPYINYCLPIQAYILDCFVFLSLDPIYTYILLPRVNSVLGVKAKSFYTTYSVRDEDPEAMMISQMWVC